MKRVTIPSSRDLYDSYDPYDPYDPYGPYGQTRKTKEDQLRKKMQETQRSSSAREMMFALEKAKRERLEATMHHFEQHMHQRELTLAEKVYTKKIQYIAKGYGRYRSPLYLPPFHDDCSSCGFPHNGEALHKNGPVHE